MICTAFYSYKGGLGRSLLVAVMARSLAADGRRVVIADLDLEAPGLHHKLGQDAAPERGLLDLMQVFLDGAEAPADLRPYLIPVIPEHLWLLPAGAAPSARYWRQLLGLVAQGFWEGGGRTDFFWWLKESLEAQFQPDHLLLDARTGVTEMGGVALGLLADQVIALTTSAPESTQGLRAVLRAAQSARQPSPSPLRLLPVLSRLSPLLPATSELQIRAQLKAFLEEEADPLAATLAVEEPQVLHHEEVVLGEERRALQGGGLRLHADYVDVHAALFGGPSPRAEDCASAKPSERPELVEQRRIVETYRRQGHQDPANRLAQARALIGLARLLVFGEGAAEAQQLARESATILNNGADLPPGERAACLHELAGVLLTQGDLPTARMALDQALDIQHRFYNTYTNSSIATTLASLAQVMLAQGDLTAALSSIEHSLKIERSLSGTDHHPKIATALFTKANVQLNQGDLSAARLDLEQSISILEMVNGPGPNYLKAISRATLGKVLTELGEDRAGLTQLEAALVDLRELFGSRHPQVAAVMALREQLKAGGARRRPTIEALPWGPEVVARLLQGPIQEG